MICDREIRTFLVLVNLLFSIACPDVLFLGGTGSIKFNFWSSLRSKTSKQDKRSDAAFAHESLNHHRKLSHFKYLLMFFYLNFEVFACPNLPSPFRFSHPFIYVSCQSNTARLLTRCNIFVADRKNRHILLALQFDFIFTNESNSRHI